MSADRTALGECGTVHTAPDGLARCDLGGAAPAETFTRKSEVDGTGLYPKFHADRTSAKNSG